MLKFSDGMQFDTSGPMRAKREHDGWYVVGSGMLIPVDSREEAEAVIREHKERAARKTP